MWNIENLIFHPHLDRNRRDSFGFDVGQPVRDSPLTCHASGQSRTGGCDREGKVVTCILNYLLPQIFFGGWWSGRAKTPRHNSRPKHFRRRFSTEICLDQISPNFFFGPFLTRGLLSLLEHTCSNTPPRRGEPHVRIRL